jgi:hypothetical protein
MSALRELALGKRVRSLKKLAGKKIQILHFVLEGCLANACSNQNGHAVSYDVVSFRPKFIPAHSASCSMGLWPSYLVIRQAKN